MTLLLVLTTVGCGARHPLADAAPDAAIGSRWVVLSARLALVRHTATLLLDGTVLIVGGVDPRGSQEDRRTASWRFDRADDQLRPEEPMAHGRADHRAVLLDDGQVLVLGGVSSLKPPRLPGWAAEVFDPAAEAGRTWGPLARGPDEWIAATMAFVLPSRRVFFLWETPLDAPSGLVDMTSGTLTMYSPGSVNTGLFATGTLADDGSVLTFGGNAGRSETEGRKILRVDPATGEARSAGLELLSARDSAAVVRRGPNSYWVAGGWETPGLPSVADSVERIDPSSGQRSLFTLDDAAYHDVRALALAAGDVLLLGASTEGLGITAGLLDAGGGYRRIAHMPYDAESLTATLLPDGSVLLVGDLRPSEGGPPGAVLRFYPAR